MRFPRPFTLVHNFIYQMMAQVRCENSLTQCHVYRDALFVHGGKPIKFPSYMLMSENLFHRVWTLVSHRRLKNVIVVLDWVPHTTKLGVATHADLDGAYPSL